MTLKHFCTAAMAAAITIAGITACSPVNDATGTPTIQQDGPMSKATSCTGLGRAHTPRIWLSGTKAEDDPASVDLAVGVDQSKLATPEEFRSLALGGFSGVQGIYTQRPSEAAMPRMAHGGSGVPCWTGPRASHSPFPLLHLGWDAEYDNGLGSADGRAPVGGKR